MGEKRAGFNSIGASYFHIMPLVKKPFIIDEEKNEIQVEANDPYVVIHLKMDCIESVSPIILSIEDAQSLISCLMEEIIKVQKNQK